MNHETRRAAVVRAFDIRHEEKNARLCVYYILYKMIPPLLAQVSVIHILYDIACYAHYNHHYAMCFMLPVSEMSQF